MIISLTDAQRIYPSATQPYLDGLETAIRELTNNPFQNTSVRYKGLDFTQDSMIVLNYPVVGIRPTDTIQISGSNWNDGLYTVAKVTNQTIMVQGEQSFYPATDVTAYLTKIEYPADIISGVIKLLQYDVKMGDKVGLKSQTISRMSETYYDQNALETINGYPATLMAFIKKYQRLRWS